MKNLMYVWFADLDGRKQMKWTKAHGKITKESKEVFIEKEDGEWIFLGVKKPGKVLKVSIDWEDFGIRRLE